MKRLTAWLGKVFSSSDGEGGEVAAPSAGGAPPDENVVQALRVYFAGRSKKPLAPEDVKVDANLFEAGLLDSLSLIEFVVFVEKKFGVTINEFELTSNPSESNISSIAGKVTSKTSKTSKTS